MSLAFCVRADQTKCHSLTLKKFTCIYCLLNPKRSRDDETKLTVPDVPSVGEETEKGIKNP